MNSRTRTLWTAAGLVLLWSGHAGVASAQTATQTVNFTVQAINQISVTGSPSLTISAATAGSNPNSVSDNTTSWAVTTNESNKKITAQLNSDMPTGLTLSASLQAPAGATSAGSVALSGTVATDLVTGITQKNASGLTITYTLAAAPTAAPGSSSRTVTFTITN